jgi:eukaryotic-like serine/threonine-protein kinase
MHYASGVLIRGKYRVVRLLGDGGMGSVYEAKHIVLETHVALKFLHSELAERPGLSERFIREARVSASIHNPHVAATTDVDVAEDGSPFLVMELLVGESLQGVLDRERKLPLPRALGYSFQMLSGLGAAHALGIVHRDMKPDNVFITRTGDDLAVVKLIDFGIAKLKSSEQYQRNLTRSGVLMGTPEYMAPEQAFSAADVDARADVYSFGVMLFEMLAGERPVDGADPGEIVAQLTSGKAKSLALLAPELPAPLTQLVELCISPEPSRRPLDARDVAQRLNRLVKTSNLEVAEDAELTRGSSSSLGQALSAEDLALSATDPAPVPSAEFGAPLLEKGQTEDAPALSLPPSRAAVDGRTSIDGRTSTELRAPSAGHPHALDGQPAPPRKRRSWLVFGLALSALLLVAAIVAIYVIDARRDIPPPFPSFDAGTAPMPESPATAENPNPTPEVAPGIVPPVPAHPPKTPGVQTPNIPDASFVPDGGWTLPPFTLPSTLPALPSTLPPLPSTLPTTLPPWPGFSPTPAKSAAPN